MVKWQSCDKRVYRSRGTPVTCVTKMPPTTLTVAAELFCCFSWLACCCHARYCRSYEDRLDTISNVREAGISVCCGGILGLGEVSEDGDQAGGGVIYQLVHVRKQRYFSKVANLALEQKLPFLITYQRRIGYLPTISFVTAESLYWKSNRPFLRPLIIPWLAT